jgi:predicted RNA-binding Zn-ribbon protein involved in translation (DUF1610 family)
MSRETKFYFMPYIKLLDVPLKCPKCGVTRVAVGMGQYSSLRSHLEGEPMKLSFYNACPDCGDRMEIDEHLNKL